MLSFKPTFPFSFTFIKKHLEILILTWASSSLVFHMMYSSQKLNKQGENIQSWHTPFAIVNQSVVPCLVPLLLYLCYRKGDHFQGLKMGSCLALGSELSEETRVLTKEEALLGRGARAESRRVREPRRTALTCGSQSWVSWWWDWCGSQSWVSWWWDWFPGCPSSIILTQSPSWCCTPCSAKMDAREKDSGRWSDMCLFFDLSRTLQVGGGLLVTCSLPGPLVIKQLMQMFAMVPGQGGRFQSVCFPSHGGWCLYIQTNTKLQ